ncbi:hypothetical protein KKF61_03490 [Patescibacteria group bacterium]|nr:hypothetical protein [Patescibacteria group bacterium]
MIVLIVILGLGVALLAISYLISSLILYPHRQAIAKTPKDFGMDYEDIEFKSTDGLTVSGWYIPGLSQKTIILRSMNSI